MLKKIQKEVENLRIKVYGGQSLEDNEKALYEIEQMLFKAMDKQLILPIVSNQRELLIALLTKLEKGGNNKFVSKDWIVDNYLQGNL